MQLKIIFFGNTKFSAIGEKILHEKLGLHTVVTIPDRIDKKNRPIPSPTKAYALENAIPVIETNKLTAEIIDQIASLKPDFFIVEDYGLILPRRLLEVPKYAPFNIHHSLLPKYRGSSPAPTAILHGEKVSGVTVIHMTNSVDAGDIYAQQSYDLAPDETTESLLARTNEMGAKLAVEVIQQSITGSVKPVPQDESQATFTKLMQKTDGYFTIESPPSPVQLDRMIRAYFPWPGVWTRVQMGRTERSEGARLLDKGGDGEWRIVKLLPEEKIQMEGKKAMSLKDFYNGYPELKETISKLFIG